MMKNNDIISAVITELSGAIAPLTALNNSESVRYLLRELGYDVPANINFNLDISDFISLPPDVALLIEAIENEEGEEIARLTIEIIPKIKNAIEKITLLSNSILNTLQTTPDFITKSKIGNNLPKRLLDYLIIRNTGRKSQKLQSILFAFGIFKREHQNLDPDNFLLETKILNIEWKEIPSILSNPVGLIKNTFNWGVADFLLQFVEIGYGELLEILNQFFHSVNLPSGIFHHHGDPNLEFSKVRNRELRVPLLMIGEWPTAYSEFGWILRLYTGEIYVPIPVIPIDEGSDPVINNGDEEAIVIPIHLLPYEDVIMDDPGISDGDTENHSYLISDRSAIPEKPSISNPTGIEAQVYLIGNVDLQQKLEFNLGADWIFSLGFELDASAREAINLVLKPDTGFSITILNSDENRINAEAGVVLSLTQRNDLQPRYLFGRENETGLSYKQVGIEAALRTSLPDNYEFGIETFVKDLRLVISANGTDGFLSNILPSGGIDSAFDITFGWSTEQGVYFVGSGGLEILLPVHIQLGPIDIQGLTIVVKPIDGNIPIEVSSTIKAELGPLSVVIENIGLRSDFSFPSDGKGKLGPIDFNFGFKPPNGLGLSINAGAVIGGGYLFFDFEKEEYAGALELTIAGFISAKAIGLITTKMPDGSKGFSMLIIITAEFNPPFQLGYGFTLIGVGGLLGLNRTVLLDPLRDGVRTGAVNNIMFPTKVIANAPRIISDLKTIFPPYEGKFLIGPMAKIGWGTPTLISLSFGLIIEIPGNIAILGILKVILPDEKVPVVKIQVAFVGTIDFDKKMLTFDASLYESSILQTMTLEGDMAVRLAWGDQPNFIMTVGGFHPSFTPPPLALPTLRRLAINILNTDIARIRVECYQAVTSNTVQFGARAEIFFNLRACTINGHIGFDALFQFNPFYFIIELSAGFKLSAVGIDVMTVRVRMSLEGLTPWHAKGTGKVSLLFFDIEADFDKTWGENKTTTLPDINILPQFIETLQKKEQWSTVLSTGKNLTVSLRKLDEATESLLVLHPAGSLVLQQKLMPLKVNIDKIGNQKTTDVKQLKIESAASGSISLAIKEVKESFARAQYQNLSDAEKLSKPSFEKMQGGIEISMGDTAIKNGKMVRRNIEYELTIIDKEPVKPFPFGKFFLELSIMFNHFIKGNSVSKSKLSKSTLEKLQPFEQKLDVNQELFTVAFQNNNKAYNTSATFGSEMEAQSFMREQINANPSLKKQIHIVPQFELQAS